MSYPNDTPTRGALVLRAFFGILLFSLFSSLVAAFVVDAAAHVDSARKTQKAVEDSKKTEREAKELLRKIEKQREREP